MQLDKFLTRINTTNLPVILLIMQHVFSDSTHTTSMKVGIYHTSNTGTGLFVVEQMKKRLK